MAIVTVSDSAAAPATVLPAVLLINPKFSGNVINSHRLAACFGIPQIWCTGHRVGHDLDRGRKTRIPPEERLRGFGKVDLIWCDRAFEILRSEDAFVVGVEIAENARSLLDFEHHAPDHDGRIVYVFGPEDGTLDGAVTAACDALVQIPALHCLNLAAAVAAVLWDRTSKLCRDHGVAAPTLSAEQRGAAAPDG